MMILDKIRNEGGEVYAILSYEPKKNYLLMKWYGFCTETEVKMASLKMLAWQKTEGIKLGCCFHIHDTKEIEGSWAGLLDWISYEFFPMNYEYGLRYNLSILSPDLFSKLSSRALQNKQNPRVPTVLFETLSEAEKWIAEKYRMIKS